MPLTKRPKRNTGPWSSSRIVDSSSPIVSKDIHAFLVTAISAWNSDNDTYTEAEKRSIIESLPLAHQKFELDSEGRLICPLSVEFVLEDPYVKSAVQRFKNDISEGYYEKSWQTQARKAMQERQEGKFDAYSRERTEQVFGDLVDNVEDMNDADMDTSDGEWSGQKPANGRSTSKGKNGEQPEALRQKRRV